MAWWEGLSPEQVRDILERQRSGARVSLEEVREWLSMETEGLRRTPRHAEVSVYVLYDAARAGGPAITLPAGTVFSDHSGLMRFVLYPSSRTIQPGEGMELRLVADYTGEEFNVAADFIDRIIEPMDLNDLWNAGALLIHQARPASGGSGPSARLEARQRAMDELALDSRIAERNRANARSSYAGAVRYTMGIDIADGQDEVVGGQVLVTGAHGDTATWEWSDTTNVLNSGNPMGLRVCDIDETCQGGLEEPQREPTLKEVWAD